MNVTEVEMKESTKHCCGNGWGLRDSAEHEGKGRALIDQSITENNSANADRRGETSFLKTRINNITYIAKNHKHKHGFQYRFRHFILENFALF